MKFRWVIKRLRFMGILTATLKCDRRTVKHVESANLRRLCQLGLVLALDFCDVEVQRQRTANVAGEIVLKAVHPVRPNPSKISISYWDATVTFVVPVGLQVANRCLDEW